MNDVSLSDVLVQLGLVSRQRLSEVMDTLSMTSEEEKFGRLLLAHGVISEEQLDMAWKMINSLREGNKTERAMAASKLVEHHAASVLRFARHAKKLVIASREGAEECKRRSGEGYPAVGMLPKPSVG